MHFYCSSHIDRTAHRRQDGDWLAAALADANSVLVPVRRSESLVTKGEDPRAVLLPAVDFAPGVDGGSPVFLGVGADERAYFAVGLVGDEPPLDSVLSGECEFSDLRRIGVRLERGEAGLLAFARALVHWHETHRFCGACGNSTTVSQGGWLRTCDNPDCGRQHFPRTDPAIIVRVTYRDRILLGRPAAWPKRWHSVLAGFVEPGESLEETVRREALEEAGVRLVQVRYDSSQPWPFPASLMLGFVAEAESDHIEIGGDELEDARWFSRQDIAEGVEAGELRLSPKTSISRHLIDDWLRSRR